MSSRKQSAVIGCEPTKFIDHYNGVPIKLCSGYAFEIDDVYCIASMKKNVFRKIRKAVR